MRIRHQLLWLIVLSRQYQRAVDLAACDHFEEALAEIERVHDRVQAPPPTDRTPIEMNILTAAVAGRLGDIDLAMAAADMAMSRLTTAFNGYSRAERMYLEEYCRVVARYCQTLNPSASASFDLAPTLDRETAVRGVRRSLLTTFPLPTAAEFEKAPAWPVVV